MELKDSNVAIAFKFSFLFLIHRVELKDVFIVKKAVSVFSVSNSPCGVESINFHYKLLLKW